MMSALDGAVSWESGQNIGGLSGQNEGSTSRRVSGMEYFFLISLSLIP